MYKVNLTLVSHYSRPNAQVARSFDMYLDMKISNIYFREYYLSQEESPGRYMYRNKYKQSHAKWKTKWDFWRLPVVISVTHHDILKDFIWVVHLFSFNWGTTVIKTIRLYLVWQYASDWLVCARCLPNASYIRLDFCDLAWFIMERMISIVLIDVWLNLQVCLLAHGCIFIVVATSPWSTVRVGAPLLKNWFSGPADVSICISDTRYFSYPGTPGTSEQILGLVLILSNEDGT